MKSSGSQFVHRFSGDAFLRRALDADPRLKDALGGGVFARSVDAGGLAHGQLLVRGVVLVLELLQLLQKQGIHRTWAV